MLHGIGDIELEEEPGGVAHGDGSQRLRLTSHQRRRTEPGKQAASANTPPETAPTSKHAGRFIYSH